MRDIFAEVLRVESVGIQDGFFELGGHSLLAAVLIAQIAQRFGVSIGLTTFLNDPTVTSVDSHLGE